MSDSDDVRDDGRDDGGDVTGDADSDGLLSRIRLIEDQPLESRAAAFAQLHEQLQAALEGSDQRS